MKNSMMLILALAATIAVFSAACVKDTSNNAAANIAANANASHDMSNMNHNMPGMDHDMSNMQGHDMMNMNSDPNAAQQPFDLQFLDSMMHHHNGAIAMAKMVLGKTERPELKAFAQKIIDDQTKENTSMQQLRDQWYPGKPAAVNMEMPGMVGGMKMMNGEHMKEMDDMEPSHFDNHFLKMMIAHHEGAVTMSKEAEQKAEHPEIKQLAERITKAQGPEIDKMKKWQAAWDK
ncbi:MAG: DUF305 domain-containing protein [Acidobacteriota bacterium]